MKVLFLNHNVTWKGGFFRAYHWGRYLKKFGHEVTILTISENNYFKFTTIEKDGVKIVKSPDLMKGKLRTGWDPWDTLARTFYLLNKKFDIIHCVDTRPNVVLPGLFLHKISGAKLVMDWGDWWGRGGTISERATSILEKAFEPVETVFEERFRKYADGHVVLNKALELRCARLGVKTPIVVIPHGADILQITPKDQSAARKRLNIDSNTKAIGYLGTIFSADAQLLVDAFTRAKKEIPELKLYIIGNCSYNFPSELISEGSLIKTGRVDFDEMTDYIASCDFMLLPLIDSIANRGRWPSKVCDYLAAGKPVIATNVGDVSELFRSSQGGYLVEDKPDKFSDKIVEAFKNGNFAEHSINARKIAEEILSWEKLTRDLESFYKSI